VEHSAVLLRRQGYCWGIHGMTLSFILILHVMIYRWHKFDWRRRAVHVLSTFLWRSSSRRGRGIGRRKSKVTSLSRLTSFTVLGGSVGPVAVLSILPPFRGAEGHSALVPGSQRLDALRGCQPVNTFYILGRVIAKYYVELTINIILERPVANIATVTVKVRIVQESKLPPD
jgi:hypothetical protein